MAKKLLILALVLVFTSAAGPVWTDSPSGTINIEVKSLSAVDNMGVNWVPGVLTFRGATHAFKFKGLKSSIAGVRNFSATGEVHNLNTASELAGKYQKADSTGTTFLAGQRDLVIRNDKGVVISIRVIKKRLLGKMRTIGEVFKREGVPLDVVPEGLTITQVQ